jgi:hypothetical protein
MDVKGGSTLLIYARWDIITEAPTSAAEIVTNAIEFAATGTRNKIKIEAAQSGTTIATATSEETPQRWLRIAGAILRGLVAIFAAVFALMQAQGWRF